MLLAALSGCPGNVRWKLFHFTPEEQLYRSGSGREGEVAPFTMLPAAVCHIKISSSEVYLYFLLKVIVEEKRAQIVCARG